MPFKDAEQKREYQRKWMAARRNEWIAQNGPCVDCETWNELEVDHIDQTTKVSHRVWSWKKERRDAELKKCCTRCHHCHKTKTMRDNSGDKCVTAKLNWQIIDEIRTTAGQTKKLALKFNISERMVRYIRAQDNWKCG